MKFSLDGRELDALDGETIWSAAARAAARRDDSPPVPQAGLHAGRQLPRVRGRGRRRARARGLVLPRRAAGHAGAHRERARGARPARRARAAGRRRARHARCATTASSPRWCAQLGVGSRVRGARAAAAEDRSHPAMAVNLAACIQCTRCVRACRDEQVNDVIGMALRGAQSRIVFDQGDAMGDSTCVACGECVQACPTGALAPANGSYATPSQRRSTRCARIAASAASSPITSTKTIASCASTAATASPTKSRLCVKGRFGFDYVHHPAGSPCR